jgi:hypothetical protein
MPRRPSLVFFSLFLIIAGLAFAQTQNAPEPVTPDASPEARALVRPISRISGHNTLSGQHNWANTKSTYTEQVNRSTGKWPAIWSSDFGFAALGNGNPIALGEVGGDPTPAILKDQMNWAWFMVWTDLLRASKPEVVREVFNDPHILSRGDTVP